MLGAFDECREQGRGVDERCALFVMVFYPCEARLKKCMTVRPFVELFIALLCTKQVIV